MTCMLLDIMIICCWMSPACVGIPQSYVPVMDNLDSPSVVEQLSQGHSLVYNTFIDDSFLALDLSYALCLVPSFLQHG